MRIRATFCTDHAMRTHTSNVGAPVFPVVLPVSLFRSPFPALSFQLSFSSSSSSPWGLVPTFPVLFSPMPFSLVSSRSHRAFASRHRPASSLPSSAPRRALCPLASSLAGRALCNDSPSDAKQTSKEKRRHQLRSTTLVAFSHSPSASRFLGFTQTCALRRRVLAARRSGCFGRRQPPAAGRRPRHKGRARKGRRKDAPQRQIGTKARKRRRTKKESRSAPCPGNRHSTIEHATPTSQGTRERTEEQGENERKRERGRERGMQREGEKSRGEKQKKRKKKQKV